MDAYSWLVIVGLGLVTVLTRGFFFISSRPWELPAWAQRGLQYAPIAALAAVVIPGIMMTDGQLIAGWRDARLFAAVASAAWVLRGGGVLGAIVSGMAVYLPLHLGLGW
jgi:branched-subunit amino acid transport protein